MRRVLSSCSLPITAVAARQMVVYSQQSPILTSNQASRGAASNIWIEDWEINRLNLTVNPKDASTTSVTIKKQLELFNGDMLEQPLDIVESPQHFSYATRKPYGNKLQMELADRAVKNGFVSKAWISRGSIKKDNLKLKQNARPVVVLTVGAVKLYHQSQLEGDVSLTYWPVSGGTRRLYNKMSEQFNLLQQFTQENEFSSALFFTTKQMEQLNLKPREGVSPLIVASSANASNQFAYFNVEQLVDPEVVLSSLNRQPVNVDSFLMTGEPITMTSLLPKEYDCKYWISARDCQLYSFTVKTEELNNGVILSASRNNTHVFNVDQLENPDAGYAQAGLVSR